jgi:hypothetical protein
MKNSLALVITENDRSHIRTIYNSTDSILNEETYTPPAELDSTEKIIDFQRYMNSEDPTWYKGGTLPDADMGTYGQYTDSAWQSHKDAYLIRLNANNDTNSGETPKKIEDGWYYYKDGNQVGPVKLDELKGQLDDKTYVWNGKVTSGWVKSNDKSVQSQLGDIVGPPKFTPPSEPKKTSEADALLRDKQINSYYDLQKAIPTITPAKTETTTTTTTVAPPPTENNTETPQ